MLEDLRLPDWLPEVICRSLIPWETGVRAQMEAFLRTYPLRLSGWIGMWSMPPTSTILAFRWNSELFADRIPYPGAQVTEWPILLIRFPVCYEIRFGGIESNGIVDDARSRGVVGDERRKAMDATMKMPGISHLFREEFLDEALQHTIIKEASGSQVGIFHGGDCFFLALTKDGDGLTIPGLVK